MRYLVIVEQGEHGWGAYVPAGRIAAAASRDEVLALIREAVEFHIAELRAVGEPVPIPSSARELVEVSHASVG